MIQATESEFEKFILSEYDLPLRKEVSCVFVVFVMLLLCLVGWNYK